jgi:hypothetical protein
MLIWEAPDASVPDRLRRAAGAGAEFFARDDGKGSVLLCKEGGAAPAGVTEKRVEVLFSGGSFGPDAGLWLFYVGLWVPESHAPELCAWYRHEHAPILLECPVWSGFQFVEQRVDRDRQYYALHWLAKREALDSEFRKLSRSTPWFRRLAANDWFDGAFVRVLGRRLAA